LLAYHYSLNNDLGTALDFDQRAMQAIKKTTGHLTPFEQIMLQHYRVLKAAGQLPEAIASLQQAHAWIQRVAEQTTNPDLRRSWLENVPVNREVLAEIAALSLKVSS
jgi:hypothetical protein